VRSSRLRKIVLLGSAVAVIWGGVLLFGQGRPPSDQPQEQPERLRVELVPGTQAAAMGSAPLSQGQEEVFPGASPSAGSYFGGEPPRKTEKDTRALLENREFPALPAFADYREVVRREPHRTPPPLLSFARGMAPFFDHALKEEATPEFRLRFLRRLVQCAESDPKAVPPSVARYCWGLVLELQGRQGADRAFQTIFEEASQRVPEDIRRTAELLQRS
jgi:hypothetical protein